MKPVRLSYILSLALFSSVSVLEATSLQEAVNNTLNNNPELKGIIQNNKAYKTYVDEAKGAYLPQIDLEVTGESRRTEVKIDGAEKTTGSQDGYDAQLNLEQLIYDGGLTPARIDESKFSERVNSYSNASKVDNVILTGIKSYLDLVKYDKRLNLSQVNVNTHQEYLKTAKSNEEISGNALDTHEVTAKLHLANKNYIDEIDNNQIAKNSFKRITGSEVEGSVCSPNVQRSTLTNSFKSVGKVELCTLGEQTEPTTSLPVIKSQKIV